MAKLKGYQGKSVLVTGHTGFKGGWISMWLSELGADVVGYSLAPPTRPSFFEAVGLKKSLTHVTGDVRDERKLTSVFRKYNPEFVFHLAAQPLVRESYRQPKLTYETNVMGTVNVLEAARKTGSVRSCVVVTSDKCYENLEIHRGYRETDRMGGYDPYSSSKGCVELVTAAYRNSFSNPKEYGGAHKLSLSSARAGNVIGGGDWGVDRLVPDCVKSLSKKRKIPIRNPNAVRPWQYVLEPVGGYLLLGSLMRKDGAKFAGAWNFGPADESIITVGELVKILVKGWGVGGYAIDSGRHPHEANILKLNSSKARKLLGWRPTYGVRESVERTVRWYRNFYGGSGKGELYELSVKEIMDFTKSAKKIF